MANQMTLEYLKQNYDNYEDRMLAAFVGKPEKFLFYKRAFSKYNVNGLERFEWVWSWWAFFGGLAFYSIEKYIYGQLYFLLYLPI